MLNSDLSYYLKHFIFLIKEQRRYNMDFKKLFEDNKKQFLGISIGVVAIIIIAFVLNVFILPNQGSGDQGSNPVWQQNPYNLPKLEEIDVATSPIMYDFVNGSLGINDDIVSVCGDISKYIIAAKEGSSRIYVTRIQGMNNGSGFSESIKNYMPNFSGEPVRVNITSEEYLNNFMNGLESDSFKDGSGVKKYKEGDYTFYVVDYGNEDNEGRVYGVDFATPLKEISLGNYEKTIENGRGISTDVIRKNCDLEQIKEMFNIDFNNEFWDTNNFMSNIKCFSNATDDNGQRKYAVLSPIAVKMIAGSDEMIYTYSINGNELNMPIDSLDQFLSENGYETATEAVKNGVYATKIEANDVDGQALQK